MKKNLWLRSAVIVLCALCAAGCIVNPQKKAYCQ